MSCHTTKSMGPPQWINMLNGIVECSKSKYCWRWKKGGPKEVETSKWSWLWNNQQTFLKVCSLPHARFKVKQICRMPCTLQNIICQFLQLKTTSFNGWCCDSVYAWFFQTKCYFGNFYFGSMHDNYCAIWFLNV